MRRLTLLIGRLSLIFIIGWQSLFLLDFTNRDRPMLFGVSFSAGQADYLGLDGREVYRALLDDLGVRRLRLGAYWNRIEKLPGEYDFSELDYYMNEALKRNAEVILVVGRRLPRWPECHDPVWVSSLSETDKEKKMAQLIEATVKRYRSYSNLLRWQIENEPFLNAFGQCPRIPHKLFRQELALVRLLDPAHPTMTTDSGELSTWLRTAPYVDFFGSTVYRIVLSPYLGYISHESSIPSAQYLIKAWISRKTADKVVLSEIQAEPWPPAGLLEVPVQEQFESMDIERFRRTVAFSRKTGFPEGYLWGAEWWYWLRQQGYPEHWEYAKTLF